MDPCLCLSVKADAELAKRAAVKTNMQSCPGAVSALAGQDQSTPFDVAQMVQTRENGLVRSARQFSDLSNVRARPVYP